MPRKNASIDQKKSLAERAMLDRLEAGIQTKIGDKDINQLYKEKLSKKLDVDESVNMTVRSIKKERPAKAPKKEPSDKGIRASLNLSKYRQQVREALDLKKKIESKTTLIYEDDEEDEVEEERKIEDPIMEDQPKIEPILKIDDKPQNQYIVTTHKKEQPLIIEPNFNHLFSEIETLKNKNKELENRLMFRNDIYGINNMRNNMLIKF